MQAGRACRARPGPAPGRPGTCPSGTSRLPACPSARQRPGPLTVNSDTVPSSADGCVRGLRRCMCSMPAMVYPGYQGVPVVQRHTGDHRGRIDYTTVAHRTRAELGSSSLLGSAALVTQIRTCSPDLPSSFADTSAIDAWRLQPAASGRLPLPSIWPHTSAR